MRYRYLHLVLQIERYVNKKFGKVGDKILVSNLIFFLIGDTFYTYMIHRMLY